MAMRNIAIEPKPGTQNHQVLEELRKGPLTPMEAITRLGVMRLAARVYDLVTEYGYNITTEDVRVPCRRGRTATVARYHLITPTNDQQGAATC